MFIFLSRFKITKVPEPWGAFYLAQFSNSGLKFLKFSMCCSMTRLRMNILYKWSKRKAQFHSEKMVRAPPPLPHLKNQMIHPQSLAGQNKQNKHGSENSMLFICRLLVSQTTKRQLKWLSGKVFIYLVLYFRYLFIVPHFCNFWTCKSDLQTQPANCPYQNHTYGHSNKYEITGTGKVCKRLEIFTFVVCKSQTGYVYLN